MAFMAFISFSDKGVHVFDQVRKAQIIRDYDEVKQGVAVFHQTTMHDLFIDRLSVTFGLRLDAEKNELSFRNETLVGGNSVAPDRHPVSDHGFLWSFRRKLP